MTTQKTTPSRRHGRAVMSNRPGRAVMRAAMAALLGLMGAAPTWAGTDLCAGLVSDRKDRPQALFPKPAKGRPYVDAQFGTRVVRITDVEAETGKAGVRKPLYATVPAWNADESWLILYQTAGYTGSGLAAKHLLFDGRTYQFIRELDIAPADLEHVYWDTQDPDVFYYPSNYDSAGKLSPQLIKYHVRSGQKEVAQTFAPCPQGGKFDFAHPKYMAWNTPLLGVRCQVRYPNGLTTVYDLSTGRTEPWIPMSDWAGLQVAPSGKLALRGPEVVQLTKGLPVLRTLKSGWQEHGSLAPLAAGGKAQGADAFVSAQFDVKPFGNVVVENLATGAVSVVMGPETGHGYPRTGSHVSTVALRNPGWVAVSMVGKQDGAKFLDQELALANIDTGKVCRVGHHHSLGRPGIHKYWAEPHVVISPSGTRMVFASDWHGSTSVDTYVLELPGSKP